MSRWSKPRKPRKDPIRPAKASKPGRPTPTPSKELLAAKALAKSPMTKKKAPRLPTLTELGECPDPYLMWAVMSEWQGFTRMGQWPDDEEADLCVRVILRARTENDLRQLSQQGIVRFPRIYLQKTIGSEPVNGRGRYFATGEVNRSALPNLSKFYPDVEYELGAALKDQGSVLMGDSKGYFGQETDLNIPLAVESFPDVPADNQTPISSASGMIAVFDYGCPFLRNEFAPRPEVKLPTGDQTQQPLLPTRIRALWHQEDFVASGPWSAEQLLGYGREMRWPTLDLLRARVADEVNGFDEAGAYRGLNYLLDYEDARRRVYFATHGAHVLDVVGGNVDPLDQQEPQPDCAASAGLMFVHMPEDTAGDSSGASLGVHLLDALRYAMENSDADKPLVVNVSYGSTAGPHDGSSIIEEAMDELLLRRKENFAIVLAAGNSRRLGLHASRRIDQTHTALFRINVAPGDHTDSFIEFWYDNVATLAEVQVRTRLPDGDWSYWVRPEDEVDLRNDAREDIVAALINRTKVPNGKRSMALLAMRPTEAPDDDDGSLADPGVWEVEVRLVPNSEDVTFAKPVQVDAWIKRDDSRPFTGRVQSHFLGMEGKDTEDTLSNLSSGKKTIVVGGYRESDNMPASYSSIGPKGPDVYGMCERDSVNPGIRAAAVRSRDTFLMNGTSVAAPVVARRIFNLMCEAQSPLDRDAVLEALREHSTEPGAFVRFDGEPATAVTPTPTIDTAPAK